MKENKKHSYHGFMLEEMLIGSGIINGIINAIIFYLINMSKTTITLQGFVGDLAFTMVILSLLLGLLEPVLVKPKIKSGKAPLTPFKRGPYAL